VPIHSWIECSISQFRNCVPNEQAAMVITPRDISDGGYVEQVMGRWNISAHRQ
jgi:hypothetical protein